MLRMLYFKAARLGKLNLFDQVVQKTLDSLMKPIECKLTLKFYIFLVICMKKDPEGRTFLCICLLNAHS